MSQQNNLELKPFLTNGYLTLATSQEEADKEYKMYLEEYDKWLLEESMSKTEALQISLLKDTEDKPVWELY